MSRLWACDRCGITAPHPAISTGTLPSGWQCVAVRLLPQPVFRDVCPACYADLEEALQSWFLGPAPGDPPRARSAADGSLLVLPGDPWNYP